MRLAAAAAVLLILGGTGHSQTFAQTSAPAQPPAKPATAAPDVVTETYAAMPEAERRAIQDDLIWTGDYAGTVDGDMGARSLAAVRAFQRRGKGKETGLLAEKERAALRAAADRRRAAVGWQLVDDKATGIRLGVPTRLVPQQGKAAEGTRWASAKGEAIVETFRVAVPGTTLQAVHDAQMTTAQRQVTYSLLRPDFFVVTGTQGGRKVYVRGTAHQGEVRGFSASYDQGMAARFDPVVIAMSSAFEGFPGVAPAVALGPLPRRKVEYGSGVFVSAEGHVATTQDLIAGCHQFTVASRGPAELVAEDEEAGLALLRVYGMAGLSPLPLAQAGEGTQVTLFGVADPSRQQGGAVVTTAAARLVPAEEAGGRPAIEPAPVLGFAGAAAIDTEGRLAGLADLRLQRVAGPPPATAMAGRLIPAAALRTLLDAHKVAPATGGGSAETAKAAVVRVICLRK